MGLNHSDPGVNNIRGKNENARHGAQRAVQLTIQRKGNTHSDNLNPLFTLHDHVRNSMRGALTLRIYRIAQLQSLVNDTAMTV